MLIANAEVEENPESSEAAVVQEEEEEKGGDDFNTAARDYEGMDVKQMGYEDYLINQQLEAMLDLAIE